MLKKCDVLNFWGAFREMQIFITNDKDEGKFLNGDCIKPGRPLSLDLEEIDFFCQESCCCFCLHALFLSFNVTHGGCRWREPVKFQVPSNFIKKACWKKRIFTLELIIMND